MAIFQSNFRILLVVAKDLMISFSMSLRFIAALCGICFKFHIFHPWWETSRQNLLLIEDMLVKVLVKLSRFYSIMKRFFR